MYTFDTDDLEGLDIYEITRLIKQKEEEEEQDY